MSEVQNEYKWQNKVILVVDDLPTNYLLIEEYIIETKCKLIHAINGYEAVEIIKSNNKIELVLMDGRLPGISGFEAIKQIHKFRPTLTIIGISASFCEKEFLEAGAVDFILIPVNESEILSKISKHI